MKVALSQLNTRVGDIQYNKNKILHYINQSQIKCADLVVFPEMAITGYMPMDLLFDNDFVAESIKAVHEIAEYAEDIHVIVGGIDREHNVVEGDSKLYNAAYVLGNRQVVGIQYKMLLPNYNLFDEERYFLPGQTQRIFNINGNKVGITICEDLWDNTYETKPMQFFNGCDLVVNLSSSPFNVNKIDARKELLKRQSQIANIIYVNQVGAQDDVVFDGASMVNSAVVGKLFEEDFVVCDMSLDYFTTGMIPEVRHSKIENIHNALVLGIRDYFAKSGFKGALIGLSGGIDSALVAMLAVEALGKANVVGVLMPSKNSSEHSVADAKELAKNLDIPTYTIPINDIHEAVTNTVMKAHAISSLADQNIQARARGNILMALSNTMMGWLVLSTGNKSELSVGYCTLYGDMAAGLNVLGDVYKTTVYKLVSYINRDMVIIPKNTIKKAPSAELAPDQKDNDDLPEYEVLDEILKLHIEERRSKDYICRLFPKDLVTKILRLLNRSEYKRQQGAPMIIISERDLINGRRYPIVNGWKQ